MTEYHPMPFAAMGHPFYPLNMTLKIYQPNNMSMPEILTYFFGGLGIILPLLSCFFMWGYNASVWRKMALCWLLSCGCIHIFFEGHFSLYHSDIASRMDFLSQVWKEYAKADSRYMTQDTFTVCMESVTAFVEGPLCFVTVWCFIKHYPSRYLCQLCVSLGQLYGTILYFLTAWKEGFKHGPMNHPLYFWFYFVFMNCLWIVIPFILIVDSWYYLSDAQSCADRTSLKKKAR